ncbi:hypothetical protein K9U14_10275 [Streptomyces griseocarneus]|nr:hypothetical protein [Streptomyces griseocarneus]MBZ6473752.1 hypothetical protein [Streptomyces griseocarneus]
MHVHGYMWVGEKAVFDREGDRRPGGPGFGGSGVPPMRTADWLLKPAGLVRGTWDVPSGAAAWLVGRLAAHAARFHSPQDRDPTRLAAHASSVMDRLAWGGDVARGYYLERPLFLSLALVTCSPNRAAPEARCPVAGSRLQREVDREVVEAEGQ